MYFHLNCLFSRSHINKGYLWSITNKWTLQKSPAYASVSQCALPMPTCARAHSHASSIDSRRAHVRDPPEPLRTVERHNTSQRFRTYAATRAFLHVWPHTFCVLVCLNTIVYTHAVIIQKSCYTPSDYVFFGRCTARTPTHSHIWMRRLPHYVMFTAAIEWVLSIARTDRRGPKWAIKFVRVHQFTNYPFRQNRLRVRSNAALRYLLKIFSHWFAWIDGCPSIYLGCVCACTLFTYGPIARSFCCTGTCK